MQELLASYVGSIIEIDSIKEKNTTIETIVSTIRSTLVQVDAVI